MHIAQARCVGLLLSSHSHVINIRHSSMHDQISLIDPIYTARALSLSHLFTPKAGSLT